ncbi:T9SS type A sorting domain-containing protein [Flavobacterium pallidum]|uniref:Fibronectin type-III domain-containing protein n=1 Tax=Flavobacterium pallidum TaxID=2172098 RepID=A0A2S1SKP8_9FLAO|nr:T9SS type A sorting domain-containing protein [Flavobacterium pallidum]AWI26959.1 hypothetical protein HYN49_14190 [Flavobacterium pallidum]
MKKITFLVVMLISFLSFGQTCEQTFSVAGFDTDPLVLSVNMADLACYGGTINSITISDATLGSDFWCGEWYSFNVDIDGSVTSMCASDLIGMDITTFSSMSITSTDLDTADDFISMSLTITVNYTVATSPNADAVLISPPDGATDAALNGVLTWSDASGGVMGYKLSVGTTSGGNQIVNNLDVGNVTTYDISGNLNESTQYFIRITPYNANGDAANVPEYSFTTAAFAAGDFCNTAIDLSALSSPITGNTTGAVDDSNPSCGENAAADLYYYILVPAGSTLTIGQTFNDYDSKNYMFFGNCNSQTTLACFDDSDTQTITWSNDTGSDQTVYWVQDGYDTEQGSFELAWSLIACTNATAGYTIVPDCANGEQFLVDVAIQDLGSATSLTVSDDQGSAPQQVTGVGTVQFGPYANGTNVVFTTLNDQDANCFIVSPAQNLAACPPQNDTCANAIDLANLISPITGNTAYALNDNLTYCNFDGDPQQSFAPDVYYSIMVPNGSTLIIGQTDNDYDSTNIAFYGDCSNPAQIACFDDGDYTQVTWINQTGSDQTVYWVQDGYDADAGNFTLAWSILNCIQPAAAFSVVPDCANGDQFLINVDITDMGSATSLSIADDQNSATQQVTATGTVQFGPYANNTPVIFSVTNDQSPDCSVTSDELNQFECPPVNDNFANAIPINCGSTVTGSTTLATIDEASAPVAFGVTDTSRNVWYSYTGSSPETITLQLCDSSYDTAVLVYTGTSGNLTVVAGNDDGGEEACFDYPTHSFVNFISDGVTTYYIDVRGYTDFANGDYSMDISCDVVTPPVVANQTCATALEIPTDGSVIDSDNSFGDVSATQPDCDDFGSIQDVWFSFIAPSDSVDCILTNGTMTSLNFNIYSGDCSTLTDVGFNCYTDLTQQTTANLAGLLNEGETYYIQVWSSALEQGTFSLRLENTGLGVENPAFANFSYHPNPVTNVLNLNAVNMSSVSVFNILGQQILTRTINANAAQIDMSALAAGSYIVKVNAQDEVKTIKVIKQ